MSESVERVWQLIATHQKGLEPILVCAVGGPNTSSGHYIAFWVPSEGKYICLHTGRDDHWQPTHWMPLPPLPEEHPHRV